VVLFAYEDATNKSPWSAILFLSIPLLFHFITDIVLEFEFNNKEYWWWKIIVIFSCLMVISSIGLTLLEGCSYYCAYPLYFVTIGNYIVSILSAIAVSIYHGINET